MFFAQMYIFVSKAVEQKNPNKESTERKWRKSHHISMRSKTSVLQIEYQCLLFRNSRSQIFFKVSVLKSYGIFTGKQKCFPFIIAQFLWRAFFHRTPPVDTSALYQYLSKLLLRRPFSYLFTLTHPSKRFNTGLKLITEKIAQGVKSV